MTKVNLNSVKSSSQKCHKMWPKNIQQETCQTSQFTTKVAKMNNRRVDKNGKCRKQKTKIKYLL